MKQHEITKLLSLCCEVHEILCDLQFDNHNDKERAKIEELIEFNDTIWAYAEDCDSKLNEK